MERTKRWMSWLCPVLGPISAMGLALGCASEKIDLGDDRDPASLGASLSDYAGVWEGYAELARWHDGTDLVRLSLDESGNGVLEIGDSEPLPAPVFNEAYPPSSDHPMVELRRWSHWLHGGFSYPIEGAVVESRRIRLGTSSNELLRAWCELQTPMPILDSPNAGYNCLGYTGYSQNDQWQCFVGSEGETEVDCGHLNCTHNCICDETSCTVPTDGHDTRLDAALDAEGEELEGSLQTPEGTFTVRMLRQ